MNKELILLKNPTQIINKTTINALIVEINKLQINKYMKEILLIACLNLLSSVKTTKALTYQLEIFRNQGNVFPGNTRSKYLNNVIKDLQSLTISDFITAVNNLIVFLNTNNIIIKV